MIETTFICDRCAARHVGERPPLGWQTGVLIDCTASNLTSCSPYYVHEVLRHVCADCMLQIADTIREALKPLSHD